MNYYFWSLILEVMGLISLILSLGRTFYVDNSTLSVIFAFSSGIYCSVGTMCLMKFLGEKTK